MFPRQIGSRYLGFAIGLLAWAIYLTWLPALLGVPGFVLYMNRFQIRPRERGLSSLFASDFTPYRNQVRRWL